MIPTFRPRHFLAAFTLAVSSLGPTAAARQGPAEKADAIVVGELRSGNAAGNSSVFTLVVVRTIKGALNVGDAAEVSWSGPLLGNGDPKGHYGLWFLKRAGTGAWGLLPADEGQAPGIGAYFRLSTSAAPAVRAGSERKSINDMIASEIGAALPSYSDDVQLYTLASALREMTDSAVPAETYAALRNHRDPELRFTALAGLISRGDSTALAEIAASAALLGSLRAARGLVCDGVRSVRDATPKAVNDLGAIASSPNRDIQLAAASALMNIHSPEALPFLVKLLDSRDPTTRQFALTGLSRFVDGLPLATPENMINGEGVLSHGPTPYRTAETMKYSLSTTWLKNAPYPESEYLQFWKSWWETRRGMLAEGQ
jgi:hypothetical protein